jgi:hypothetical protein
MYYKHFQAQEARLPCLLGSASRLLCLPRSH